MRIYFIEDVKGSIAFFCNSLEYIKITSEEKKVIEKLASGKKTSDDYGISSKRLDVLKKAVKLNSEEHKECNFDIVQSVKLTLNISNVCNMNCGYCYAGGGCYGSASGLMNAQTAIQSIDVFYEKFGVLDCVKFIGGEPLLNVIVIKEVCKYIDTKIAAKKLEKRPVYSVITNGTIINDGLIELIKEYNIRVAVSIDGPKAIHDEARKMKNNTGSYSSIMNTVAKLRAKTDNVQPVAINAVFSEIHIKHGLSVMDTLSALRNETNIKDIHIVPVDAASESFYRLTDNNCFVKGVEDEVATNTEEDYFWLLKCIFVGLRKKIKSSNVICNAGLTTFSVSINGDIFPCHLFTNNNSYGLGNVYDKDVFESKEYFSFRKSFSAYNRFTEGKCKNCFANKLCVGCAGANLFRTGNLYESDEFICNTFRNSVIIAIKSLCGERSNEQSYT